MLNASDAHLYIGAMAAITTSWRFAFGSIGSEWSISHAPIASEPSTMKPAALEAALHERVEGVAEIVASAQLLRQHERVLDRLRRALAAVRRGRVRGVADQHDVVAVPRRRHDDVLDRPVDDGVVVDDQLAHLGDRAAEARQPLAVGGGEALRAAAAARALRRLLDRQHVHQVGPSGTKPAVPVGADVDPDLVQALDPRQVVAPARPGR